MEVGSSEAKERQPTCYDSAGYNWICTAEVGNHLFATDILFRMSVFYFSRNLFFTLTDKCKFSVSILRIPEIYLHPLPIFAIIPTYISAEMEGFDPK